MAGAILMGLINPFSGTLYDRIGIRKLAISGNLVLTLSTLVMVWFDRTTPIAIIVIAYALRCVGMALAMMPTFSASMNALPQKMTVDGNSAGSTIRQVAGSLGTALMMMVVSLASHGSNSITNLTTGYHWAYITATAIAFLSLLCSFTLRDDE